MRKFTDEQVIEIRKKRKAKMTYRDLADEYNTSRQTIFNICRGRYGYNKVGYPILEQKIIGRGKDRPPKKEKPKLQMIWDGDSFVHPNAKYTVKEIQNFRQLYDEGYSVCSIALAYGVHEVSLYRIINRNTYKGVK